VNALLRLAHARLMSNEPDRAAVHFGKGLAFGRQVSLRLQGTRRFQGLGRGSERLVPG
jgi:hypothetical protein